MEYRIGLDIGIGSVGWAVVSAAQDNHPARIEDFGTRIFSSGENAKDRESLCQQRRASRGVRRLERRREHRRKMLLNHFQNIGILNATFHDDMAEIRDKDVYSLKVVGLTEKLSPAELYKCLVHTSNHRGYRDFYEPEEDDEEASTNAAAANAFENAYRESACRSVSEYLINAYGKDSFVRFRNRSESDLPHILIRRNLFQEEAAAILKCQQRFYPQLKNNIEKTLNIIFKQRDFEAGPGKPDDATRRYHGFLETLGRCPFYKEEDRGFRGTVIADVFAVTNTLSQYRFVNKATGEYKLEKEIAHELVDTLLRNAKLNMTDVKNILKAHGYILLKGENSDDKALNKSVKFLKLAKECLQDKWEDYILQEQFDVDNCSVLHSIGVLLSTYQTPSRRKEEMEKAGIDKALIRAFSNKKVSGTASASYRYMCDAIHAFLDGDIYGNFQAVKIREQQVAQPTQRAYKLKPSHIDDPEIRDNRVVFKAVNETRKIVNAIIDIYGSPTEIVVEVASELGQSFQMRGMEEARQRNNEKANDKVKNEIAQLLHVDITEVRGEMIDRYKLFAEQEGKCAYSGKPLGEKRDVVLNRNREYEIDHIVPYSLILDNTLQNKALVFSGENQRKGQQTPLMYLDQAAGEKFKTFVNHMYTRKENPISRKKLAYYLMPSIRGEEAEETLTGWKSRNINDTRYITKYICGILDKNLLFAGEKKQHVYSVKGAVTQRFRREWLRTSIWGEEQKNRENYLNHAMDALIAANLTRPYIEVGSDAMKLRSIFFANQKRITGEYNDYLDACVRKMEKYYGFQPGYTRNLLKDPHRIPSFIPRLAEEAEIRFNDSDSEGFAKAVRQFYGDHAEFVVPPHIPLTSHKQEKKYQGCIANDKPIRIVDIDGEKFKVNRKSIRSIGGKELAKLYTDDPSLRSQLTEVLAGKPEKYTVGDYLKDNGLDAFRTASGQIIRKVSVLEGKVTNYYRKENGNGNYTVLGGLKYYCVEIYKNQKGETCTCGVRFVDVVKKNGKLWRKRESLPENYGFHVMYLQDGDYIRITSSKGIEKIAGYYHAVENVNKNQYKFYVDNQAKIKCGGIASKDIVKKYAVTMLGIIGGEVRCSEPLPFIGEKR